MVLYCANHILIYEKISVDQDETVSILSQENRLSKTSMIPIEQLQFGILLQKKKKGYKQNETLVRKLSATQL